MKGWSSPAAGIHPNVAHNQLEPQPPLRVTGAIARDAMTAVPVAWNGMQQASEDAIRARLP
jgi:hypothetical protein